MNRYQLIHLVWLLPLYFLSMHVYQWLTLSGVDRTFDQGESYVADVIDFDVTQIAAQTSGYVVLGFQTDDGREIEQQLSLSVQMAQVIMDSERIPIRYLPGSFREIVIVSTYPLQRNVIRVNLGVTAIGMAATLIVALYASRYARRRSREGEQKLHIERTDTDQTDGHPLSDSHSPR